MDSREALVLADCNLAEALRDMTRWHAAGEIREAGDLLLLAGIDPFPLGFCNAALALGPGAPSDPRVLFTVADRFFAERGRGYTLWTRAHLDADLERAAEAAGLQPISTLPGMILDAPLPEAPAPDGIRIERVEDAGGVADLGAVSAQAYATAGMPVDVTANIFSMPERAVQPHWIHVVAYAEGRPVSAAQALLSHGIAGIYWVGTAPEGRKRGLGEACTRAAGNAAFQAGARAVVLQASQQGDPIYRRMGYREITRYAWWARFAGSA